MPFLTPPQLFNIQRLDVMGQAPPPDLAQNVQTHLAQLEEQSHYERLNLTQEAQPKDIRRAYMKLAAKWHPDRFAQFTLPSQLAASIQRLFALITESHTVLSNEEKRKEYDEQLLYGDVDGSETSFADILNADNEFRTGQRLLEKGKFRAALQRFEKACETNPDSAEFQAFRAWAFYKSMPRNAEGIPTYANYVEECKKIFSQAIEDLEEFDMGYFFLSMVHFEHGEDREGMKLLKTALTFNPKNTEAQRQMRLINMRGGSMRKSSSSEGFFSKLLNRFKGQ